MWLKKSDSRHCSLNANAVLYHVLKMSHKSSESDVALSLDDIQHNDIVQN